MEIILGLNLNIPPCLYRKCFLCDFCIFALNSLSEHHSGPHTLLAHTPNEEQWHLPSYPPAVFDVVNPVSLVPRGTLLIVINGALKQIMSFKKLKPHKTNAFFKIKIHINLRSLNYAEVNVTQARHHICVSYHITFCLQSEHGRGPTREWGQAVNQLLLNNKVLITTWGHGMTIAITFSIIIIFVTIK